MDTDDRSEWKRPEYFDAEQKKIQDEFYARPLKLMAPPNIVNKETYIQEILIGMCKTAHKINIA